MDTFHSVVNIVSFTLNIIGALITIWGIIVSLFEFLKKEILNRAEVISLNEAIRLKLGSSGIGVFYCWRYRQNHHYSYLGELRDIRRYRGHQDDIKLFLNQRFKEGLRTSRLWPRILSAA
jgi:hypothetical protein